MFFDRDIKPARSADSEVHDDIAHDLTILSAISHCPPHQQGGSLHELVVLFYQCGNVESNGPGLGLNILKNGQKILSTCVGVPQTTTFTERN